MQLWFRHGTEVSIREQLVTQIVVGILSGDLVSGQRLPSTRDLARRFHLHPTLISAAYRQLERERWVELLHGSGVYVRETKPQRQLSPALAVDEMIRNLFRSAREIGGSVGKPPCSDQPVAGFATSRPFSIDRAGRRVEKHCGV